MLCAHTRSAACTPKQGDAHTFGQTWAHTAVRLHADAHVLVHTRACTHVFLDAHTLMTTPQHRGRWHRESRARCTRGPGAGGTCTNVTARGTCTEATLVHGGSESRGSHSPRVSGDAEQPPPAHSHAGSGAASLTPQPSPGKAAGCACQFLDIPVKFFPLHLCGNDLLRAPRSSSPVRSHQARSFGEIKS